MFVKCFVPGTGVVLKVYIYMRNVMAQLSGQCVMLCCVMCSVFREPIGGA